MLQLLALETSNIYISYSSVIRRNCGQTLIGLGLEQRTDIDISIIISLQRRKGT